MIRTYPGLIQGSDEWYAARRGMLTASEMKLIVTPTLTIASNDKARGHVWELLSQRISGYVEPQYVSDDMLRGQEDEMIARLTYAEKYAPVEEVGFVTNDEWGFTLGYSPDGFVGDNGAIECKSRRQKFQVQTIVSQAAPDDYTLQIQTGLLVSGRKWLDFVSYSAGLPMITIRCYPIPAVQEAIIKAATAFYASLDGKMNAYHETMKSWDRLIPTERRIEAEMHI
jgi:predicted phage-related endonuclease